MNLNFASIWENTSDLIPNETAIVCGENSKTWQEYNDIAAKLASGLMDAG